MNYKTFDPEEEFDEMTEELVDYCHTRDNGLCQVKGIEGSEFHHIVYRSQGGKNKANNLILLSQKAHYNEHCVEPLDEEFYFNAIKRNEKRFRRNMV